MAVPAILKGAALAQIISLASRRVSPTLRASAALAALSESMQDPRRAAHKLADLLDSAPWFFDPVAADRLLREQVALRNDNHLPIEPALHAYLAATPHEARRSRGRPTHRGGKFSKTFVLEYVDRFLLAYRVAIKEAHGLPRRDAVTQVIAEHDHRCGNRDLNFPARLKRACREFLPKHSLSLGVNTKK